MKNKIGIFCMVLGAGLVAAALSLLLWNRQEDRAAGKAAASILPQVISQIEAPAMDSEGFEPSYPDPYDPAMAEVEIEGRVYIGYLSIPAIELELPVIAQWDYASLKIAPCRYAGSAKTDDLVLCAHNYDKHFGRLQNLDPGDAVYFTDMDGVVFAYEVAGVEILEPTAIKEMTAGVYDLTLFTCTYGGESRVTVRCSKAETDTP